eukprot:849216-Rhodomonas_salina.1
MKVLSTLGAESQCPKPAVTASKPSIDAPSGQRRSQLWCRILCPVVVHDTVSSELCPATSRQNSKLLEGTQPPSRRSPSWVLFSPSSAQVLFTTSSPPKHCPETSRASVQTICVLVLALLSARVVHDAVTADFPKITG